MDSGDELIIMGTTLMFMCAAAYKYTRKMKKPKTTRAKMRPYLQQREAKGRFTDVCVR